MREKLPGAGFGQPHQVFDFEIVVELGLFLGGQCISFLTFEEIPNSLTGRLGGLEIHHLARAERGDELNQFLVWFHAEKFSGKRAVGQWLFDPRHGRQREPGAEGGFAAFEFVSDGVGFHEILNL
jgi:hypothetical protein